MGALTSKLYSFKARPWELSTINTYNLFDASGTKVRLDLKDNEILRILPSIGSPEPWLADTFRFAFESFQNEVLESPLVRTSSYNFTSISWSQVMREVYTWFDLLESDFRRQNELNFHMVFGPFVDIEVAGTAKDIFSKASFATRFITYPPFCYFNSLFRSFYLFNLSLDFLDTVHSLFLIGTNPRIENVLFNLKLRQVSRINYATFKIYTIGGLYNPIFKTYNLGNNIGIFFKLLSGSNRLWSGILRGKFVDARTNLAFIFGSSFYQRWDVNKFEQIVNLFFNILISINPKWLNFPIFNFLPIAISSTGFCELGFEPFRDEKALLTKKNIFYLLNADELNIELDSNINKLKTKEEVQKNLKTTEGVQENSVKVLYQGALSDSGILQANLVLPTANMYEEDGEFLNMTGDNISLKAFLKMPTHFKGKKTNQEVIAKVGRVLGVRQTRRLGKFKFKRIKGRYKVDRALLTKVKEKTYPIDKFDHFRTVFLKKILGKKKETKMYFLRKNIYKFFFIFLHLPIFNLISTPLAVHCHTRACRLLGHLTPRFIVLEELKNKRIIPL